MKNIILTGDRPTGKLHLGHYVGSLKTRLQLQDENDYKHLLVMIADVQALTDNFEDPSKIKSSVNELLLDYLAIGLDPNKVSFFVQSQITALFELTVYYMNLVTLARLKRNPTVKNELKLRNFDQNIPVGFLAYPISQAADITAFKANLVPVGNDQLPMIEQTKEIVKSFNNYYGEILVTPEAIIPKEKTMARLPGIDGKNKMSKSLGNTIYLSDEENVIKEKVMAMYTDPNHIKIEDPGQVEGNIVFTYLDIFCTDEDFNKYLPEYENLQQLKDHYQKGGLGDVKIKLFLNNILQDFLRPIREKRNQLKEDQEYLDKILKDGNETANKIANETLKEVRKALNLNYFN